MLHSFKPTALVAAMCSLALTATPVLADNHKSMGKKSAEITLIHTGDFHGHLIPRPNLRSDGDGRMEGGVARIYTKIQDIRKGAKNTLLLHTGDTIQGGAEVLFTRGQAMVDVLDNFGIDGFAPGNWEFVYGTARFQELFGKGRWGTVSANVRLNKPKDDGSYACPDATKPDQTNLALEHAVPPYIIKQVGGLKVGILGFTTDRGPQVVGTAVTDGLCFLSSAPGTAKQRDASNALVAIDDVSEVEFELRKQIKQLREVEKVDLLVMLSELGLANNSLLASRNNGIDVILSSDMHEETRDAAVVTTPNGGKTIVAEEGQDGTQIGQLKLEIRGGAVKKWTWKAHRIHDGIKEDKKIAAQIAELRKPFVGKTFVPQTNPFHGGTLSVPIDTVVGSTEVGLHRTNFAHENMPAVIEGTGHVFLADAFRAVAGTDIGAIRGFRYGTHIVPGKIKLEDLYHFMPIGPQIARGNIAGQALKNQIENAANGSLNPDPRRWTGGWLFNFSGVTMDFDPYAKLEGKPPFALDNGRAFNIKVNGKPLTLKKEDGTTNMAYSYASYWYGLDKRDKCLVNRVPLAQPNPGECPSLRVAVRDANGKAKFVTYEEWQTTPAGQRMDGTEVVVQYINDTLGGTLKTLEQNRTTLRDKATGQPTTLPAPIFGNPEVQPLRGSKR